MTDLKLIRTEEDYEAALAIGICRTPRARYRAVVRRQADTEGDQPDVLATFVEAYQSEHRPMDPPDPIEAIKFRIEQQGLTRNSWERLLAHAHAGTSADA